jgi:hypothetical protein
LNIKMKLGVVLALAFVTLGVVGTASAAPMPTGLRPHLTEGGLTQTLCWRDGGTSCYATNNNVGKLRFALNMRSWSAASNFATLVNTNADLRRDLRGLARALTGKRGWRVIRPATSWHRWTLVKLTRW